MTHPKRDVIARACAAEWRSKGHSISKDDWPGVVVQGDGWRVIVGRDVGAYRLQTFSGSKWLPTYCPQSVQFWSETFRNKFPDLPEALKQLPADPLDAVAALAAKQGVNVPAQRRLRYWSAPDYSGVLAQKTNMRSVRDRTGCIYGLQWVSVADYEAGKPLLWVTQCKGPSWPDLVDRMALKVWSTVEGRRDEDEIREQLASLFEGFPEIAADGPWPVVKAPSAASRRVAQQAPCNITSLHGNVKSQ